jgi:hypothetical protein
MKLPKKSHKIILNQILEHLVELRWKTIRSRRFIVFHLKHYLSNLLLRELLY